MRADLRLSDLKTRERSTSRLMNVKIPAQLSDAIEEVVRALGASKTEVAVALLNEGLSMAQRTMKDFQPLKSAALLAKPRGKSAHAG
jgi:hypothetical protein